MFKSKGEYLSVHSCAVNTCHRYVIIESSEGAVCEIVEIRGGGCYPFVFNAEESGICYYHLYLGLANGQGYEIVEVTVLERFVINQALLFGEYIFSLYFDVLT